MSSSRDPHSEKALEAYRSLYGALPPDLASVGLEDPDIRYSRMGDEYALEATDGPLAVQYRPGDPQEERFEAERARLRESRES